MSFFIGGLVYIARIPALHAGENGAVPLSSTLIFRFLNSVGSECNPYKVEVVGSSPTGTTREVLLLLDFRQQRKVVWRLRISNFGAVADVVIAAD